MLHPIDWRIVINFHLFTSLIVCFACEQATAFAAVGSNGNNAAAESSAGSGGAYAAAEACEDPS